MVVCSTAGLCIMLYMFVPRSAVQRVMEAPVTDCSWSPKHPNNRGSPAVILQVLSFCKCCLIQLIQRPMSRDPAAAGDVKM
jgi:hypothetical protein